MTAAKVLIPHSEEVSHRFSNPGVWTKKPAFAGRTTSLLGNERDTVSVTFPKITKLLKFRIIKRKHCNGSCTDVSKNDTTGFNIIIDVWKYSFCSIN